CPPSLSQFPPRTPNSPSPAVQRTKLQDPNTPTLCLLRFTTK
ncbi:unnamed protein product, partial [Ectocarpus sp. 6 AP-2014]